MSPPPQPQPSQPSQPPIFPLEIILENILIYLTDEMLCKFARMSSQWNRWIQRHYQVYKIPLLLAEIDKTSSLGEDYAETSIDIQARCIKISELSPIMQYRVLLFFYLRTEQCGLCFRNCYDLETSESSSMNELVLIDSFSVRACPCILLHLMTKEQITTLITEIELNLDQDCCEQDESDDDMMSSESIADSLCRVTAQSAVVAASSLPWRTVYRLPNSVAHYSPITLFLRHIVADAILRIVADRPILIQAKKSLETQRLINKTKRRDFAENALQKENLTLSSFPSDTSFRALLTVFSSNSSEMSEHDQSVLLMQVGKFARKHNVQARRNEMQDAIYLFAAGMGVPETVVDQVVRFGEWPTYVNLFVESSPYDSSAALAAFTTSCDALTSCTDIGVIEDEDMEDDLTVQGSSIVPDNIAAEQDQMDIVEVAVPDISKLSVNGPLMNSFPEVAQHFALEIYQFYQNRRDLVSQVQSALLTRCCGHYFGLSLQEFTIQAVDFLDSVSQTQNSSVLPLEMSLLETFLDKAAQTASLQSAWRAECFQKLDEYLLSKTPALAVRIVPLSRSLLQDAEFLLQDALAAEYQGHTPLPDILEEWMTSNPSCSTHFTTCLETTAARIVTMYRAGQCRNALVKQLQSLWPDFTPLHLVDESTPLDSQFCNSHVIYQFYQTTKVGQWIHTPRNCGRLFRHQVLARRMALECPSFEVSACFPDAQTLYRSFISFDSVLVPVCNGVWPTSERLDITVSLLREMHGQHQERLTQASSILATIVTTPAAADPLSLAHQRYLDSEIVQEWARTPSLSPAYLHEVVSEMARHDTTAHRQGLITRLISIYASVSSLFLGLARDVELFVQSRTFQSCLDASGAATVWIHGGGAELLDVGVAEVAGIVEMVVDGQVDHVVVQTVNTLF